MANCIGMFTQLELIFRSSIFKSYAMVEITGKSRHTISWPMKPKLILNWLSSLVFGAVYQEKSCVLLYTLYFMEISLSILVKPARGYIQVSKSTHVRFVLVMSTIMLLRTLNSFLHVHVSDLGQLLLIACT